MKRRAFLASSLSLPAATAALSALPTILPAPVFALDPENAFRKNIGIQLYTLRNQIKADTDATIKAVVDAGYKQGELYGFPNCQPMIDAAREHGLDLHSAHFNWECVTTPSDAEMSDFQKILAQAKELGLSHLVIPYIHGKRRETLDHYRLLADHCNQAAELAKAAGITLAYHNHAFEFQPMGGAGNQASGYEILMAHFSPDMKFEVDVFWVQVAGHDPATLVKKLRGRVSQLHLKDLKKDFETPNFGKIPNDAFKELGTGQIAMEPLIKLAGETGVAHCHVEQDQSPDALASIQQSLGYLKSL